MNVENAEIEHLRMKLLTPTPYILSLGCVLKEEPTRRCDFQVPLKCGKSLVLRAIEDQTFRHVIFSLSMHLSWLAVPVPNGDPFEEIASVIACSPFSK
jgi:hypothetical protein